ncbi:unnamed protein product, partial [Polarella glacialis]
MAQSGASWHLQKHGSDTVLHLAASSTSSARRSLVARRDHLTGRIYAVKTRNGLLQPGQTLASMEAERQSLNASIRSERQPLKRPPPSEAPPRPLAVRKLRKVTIIYAETMERLEIDVSAKTHVDELKQRVFEAMGLPIDRQCIRRQENLLGRLCDGGVFGSYVVELIAAKAQVDASDVEGQSSSESSSESDVMNSDNGD